MLLVPKEGLAGKELAEKELTGKVFVEKELAAKELAESKSKVWSISMFGTLLSKWPIRPQA